MGSLSATAGPTPAFKTSAAHPRGTGQQKPSQDAPGEGARGPLRVTRERTRTHPTLTQARGNSGSLRHKCAHVRGPAGKHAHTLATENHGTQCTHASHHKDKPTQVTPVRVSAGEDAWEALRLPPWAPTRQQDSTLGFQPCRKRLPRGRALAAGTQDRARSLQQTTRHAWVGASQETPSSLLGAQHGSLTLG